MKPKDEGARMVIIWTALSRLGVVRIMRPERQSATLENSFGGKPLWRGALQSWTSVHTRPMPCPMNLSGRKTARSGGVHFVRVLNLHFG
jgi:hypothetical protein